MKQRRSSRKIPAAAAGRVLVEREGAIATVILSHPGRLNVLTTAMWRQVREVFGRLSRDRDLRCIVVRGAGRNFAAGADITEFPAERTGFDRVYRYHQDLAAPALRSVAECVHPTVAMIQGVCVGGGLEIACQCDLRIAGASARFGLPINRLGFPAAPGELGGLLALAGRAVTLELLLEGQILEAKQALAKGLLTRLVADAKVESEAYRCAEHIVGGAPLAARINKQLVRRLAPAPAAFTKPELRAFFAAWCGSFDHHEGVRAFLEKRRPRFRGTPP